MRVALLLLLASCSMPEIKAAVEPTLVAGGAAAGGALGGPGGAAVGAGITSGGLRLAAGARQTTQDTEQMSSFSLFGFSSTEILLFIGIAVFLWAGGGTWLRARFKRQIKERDQQKDTEIRELRRDVDRLWDRIK